jgi:FkbM family methyltransferase
MSFRVLHVLRPVLRHLGMTLNKYPPKHVVDFMKLLSHHEIDLVVDVGGNTGQFGLWLRDFGYKGRILSFEPIYSEYQILLQTARKDKNWIVADRCALGDFEGELELNVSQNSVSSSFLPLTSYITNVSPATKYVRKETVKVHRLDQYDFNKTIGVSEKLFLKMDVQGFEDRVLRGAEGLLHKTPGLLIEMSLVQLYEGQATMQDLMQLAAGMGYVPYYVIPHITTEPSGRLLQVDMVFFKG